MSEILDEESYQKVMKCYQYSKDNFANAIEDSEEAMRYVVTNKHWDDEAISEAETFKKPYLTYNILTPIVNTLVGNEQINRRRAKFKPRNIESVEIADIIQDRYNALNDEQNIEELLQMAFLDGLITPLGGWIERTIVINEEGYLDFNYRLCNQFRLFPDPELLTNDCSLQSCNWIIKETFERLETIENIYNVSLPEKIKNQTGFWWSLLDNIRRLTSRAYSQESDNYDKVNDKYRVLEMLERIQVPVVFIWDGIGFHTITKEQYQKDVNNGAKYKIVREFTEPRIQITTVVPHFENTVIYKKQLENPSNNFGLFNVYSFRFNAQSNEATSLVKMLIDPQDDINKGRSQFRDYITQILAGMVVVYGREDEVVKLIKEKGNQPNLVVNPRSVNSKIEKIAPGNVPPEIIQNVESAVMFSERSSMVTQTVKGQTERSGESGVLFQKKLEVASAAINPYFKSLALLRKELARDFVQNFGYVYGDYDRILRLKSAKGENYDKIVNLKLGDQIFNDIRNPEIYVELDEGEDNLTRREDNFNQLLAVAQIVGQINPAYVDVKTLLENAPINGIDKWLQYLEAVSQAQGAEGEQLNNIQKTKAMLENLKIQRGIENEDQRLRLEAANALIKLNPKGVER